MPEKEMSEIELTRLIKQLNLDELERESIRKTDDSSNKSGSLLHTDGWVQIKDQMIIVHDPTEDGKQPIIHSADPVKLKVNDKDIENGCVVSSMDRIQWEIVEKELFDITVAKDKLHAYFHLFSKERFAWQLVDTEPTQQLSIRAEENKDIVLESVRLTNIVKKIGEESITSNLDIGSIHFELENPTYKPVLIAKGKEAIPGKDAQLEMYFSEQVEKQFFEVSGKIDYRNHLQIPSVRSGDLIAKKIPLVDGIPGYDVYGNAIIPASPKDIIVVTKPSIELTSNGEIKALKDGRPRITGTKIKTFDISTAYVVSGNVDIETGNIVFSGDVIVYGNVTDNMIIESLGNVYVYGSVYNATISATGSVYIRGNVLGSKLYCGYFGVLFNRLYNVSKILEEHINKLLSASQLLVQTLETSNQKVRYSQIVMLLLESKFIEIPALTKELLVVVSNIQHIKKDEYQKLLAMCALFSQPTRLINVATVNLIQSFLTLLQETHQEVARMQEEKTEIRLNQCHNSEIKSNGDIFIIRDGVILSVLYATRDIHFYQESAVCRGSRLEAEGSIFAKIVGGETGVNTVLKANKQVTIRIMHIGRICVGRYCIDIDSVIEDRTFNVHDLKR